MAKRICVIDDDMGLRTAYAAALSRMGYEVDTATDGAEGQAKISEKKPDAILLDMLMPNMDGETFIKQLRSDPSNQDIIVIVASNFESMPDLNDPNLKVAKYLVKTEHSPDEIAALADKVIQGS